MATAPAVLSTVRQQQQQAGYYARVEYPRCTLGASVRRCCHPHWPMHVRTFRNV